MNIQVDFTIKCKQLNSNERKIYQENKKELSQSRTSI